MSDREPRIYRIEDNVIPDPRAPLVLIDCATHQVVRLGSKVQALADHAFDELGADEVRDAEDFVVCADSRFMRESTR